MYWMVETGSMMVATGAMLGGIGGAAIFIPIFLIVFPILGPEYIIVGHASAISVALLTQSFGFSSGLVRYLKRGLVDFKLARLLLTVAVPSAILGAFFAQFISAEPFRMFYSVLMIALGIVFLDRQRTRLKMIYLPNIVLLIRKQILGIENRENRYSNNRQKDRSVAGIGGFLTGMTSVGIGECIVPQLVKICRVPMPIAAATSVLVVLVTIISASITHVSFLLSAEGVDGIPWDLLVYTIPGVIIGGQIGSKLQGQAMSQNIKKIIPILFFVIGVSMIYVTCLH